MDNTAKEEEVSNTLLSPLPLQPPSDKQKVMDGWMDGMIDKPKETFISGYLIWQEILN